jgi:replicative DNA helicase
VAAHHREYAAIVHDLAQIRRLMHATYEIQAPASAPAEGSDELIERAEQLIFRLRASTVRGRQRLLADAVGDEVDRLAQCSQSGRAVPGLTTSIAPLDELLGGLQQGRLYVVAARPSIGKSLIALQIARHVAAVEHGASCSPRSR